jgi:hypothetical protein
MVERLEPTAAAEERAEHQGNADGKSRQVPMTADRHTSGSPAVETPVEARQGFLGRPVLMVLVGGLMLAGATWIAVHYLV